MPRMICACGVEYSARKADLQRGWGLSHDKSCAAKRRKFGWPKAKTAPGEKGVKKNKPKPSTARPNDNRTYGRTDVHDNYDDCEYDPSWDAHKSYRI